MTGAAGARQAAPATAAGATAAGRRLRRIVVVEDDPDIRAVVALVLGRVGGLDVACCDGGAAALELVPATAPDLVLLDVMMPGIDGLETLARLRRDPRSAHIPVVFMTARAQPRDRAGYLAQGAAAVIAKPFDPMTLFRQLESVHAPDTAAA